MKALYLIPADDISRDADTSQISIFKIINSIRSHGFPVILHRVGFFTMIELDEREQLGEHFDLQYTLQLNGTEITSSTVSVTPDKKHRAQVTLTFLGLVIPEAGDLTLAVSYVGQELIRTSISIELITEGSAVDE